MVSSEPVADSNPGCAIWDWSNQICQKCSINWVFSSSGVCIQVSSLCKTSDGTLCTSCYFGYSLVQGQCIIAPVTQVVDVGCSEWDWNNQVCLKCSYRYVLDSKGKCTTVSDQCK